MLRINRRSAAGMNPVAGRVAPFLLVALLFGIEVTATMAAELRAGAARVDITRPDGPVSGPLFSKALVLSDGEQTVALVSLDVVAIGEIGYIKNDFLPKLRQRIEAELKIPPQNVLVNASHCHGIPCADALDRTFQAVKTA